VPETHLQNTPQVGDTPPDFTLPSTSGENVTLSSFKGKKPVLLAFFPLAFTGVCSIEMKCFEDDYDQFAATGVEVLPISVDSTASLKEFKNKLGSRTQMLSDFRRDVSRAYGVLLPTFYSNRAYFLVDRDGILSWSHVEANPGQRRENSEILAEIAKVA
jgi:peroxiredoxin